MANTRGASVWRVDTTAALPDAKRIVGFKFIAGSSATFTVRDAASDGNIIYYVDGASDVFEQVKIVAGQGIHVTVGGSGGILYVYLA
jgi:hypothetical protein